MLVNGVKFAWIHLEAAAPASSQTREVQVEKRKVRSRPQARYEARIGRWRNLTDFAAAVIPPAARGWADSLKSLTKNGEGRSVENTATAATVSSYFPLSVLPAG